jgi:hypothetical protein
LSVGVALAEVLPGVPDEGDGVLDAPSEAEAEPEPETDGLGVKTDGDGVGDPPPEQAATVTARMAVAAGTVRRTFMKPPVMTGGQWRRPTHLSMCHPDRRRKRERAKQPAPVPDGRHNSRPTGGTSG